MPIFVREAHFSITVDNSFKYGFFKMRFTLYCNNTMKLNNISVWSNK